MPSSSVPRSTSEISVSKKSTFHTKAAPAVGNFELGPLRCEAIRYETHDGICEISLIAQALAHHREFRDCARRDLLCIDSAMERNDMLLDLRVDHHVICGLRISVGAGIRVRIAVQFHVAARTCHHRRSHRNSLSRAAIPPTCCSKAGG